MIEFEAKNDRVIFVERSVEAKTESGIQIATNGEEASTMTKYGEVISVGPDVKSAKVGDNVLFDWARADLLYRDLNKGTKIGVVREESIHAKIKHFGTIIT